MVNTRVAATVLCTCLAAGAAHASTIFSDFAATPPLYDTTGDYPINASGAPQTLDAQFVSTGDDVVTDIDLGLVVDSAGDELQVSLWTSESGTDPGSSFQLGTELFESNVTPDVADGSGTQIVSVSVPDISLTAADYFIQVAPVGTGSGEWYFNSAGANGLSFNNAGGDGEGFTPADVGILPAFSVNGTPSSVPEPASLALFGAALAGLGAVRRRKHKDN